MDRNMLQRYLELGWVIVPTQRGNTRAPQGEEWQKRTEPERDLAKYQTGAFLVCGRASGVSVIDLDGHRWDDRFQEVLDEHPTPVAQTPGGGHHILVRYSSAAWWNNRVKIVPEIDLRTEGGGIALPVGGLDRTWLEESAPWEIPLADPGPYEALLLRLADECRAETGAKPGEPIDGQRSSLAMLLAKPPEGEGSRNDWLVKVAGHLAKIMDHQDGWITLVHRVNLSLDDPLPWAEVNRTVGKLWQADRAKRPENTPPGLPVQINAQGDLAIWKGEGDRRTLEPWMRPAPRILAAYRSDSAAWWRLGNDNREILLRPADIHVPTKLATILGNIGVKIFPAAVGNTPNGAQVQAWLEWASPDPIVSAPWWGWNDDLDCWVGLDSSAEGPDGCEPNLGRVDRPDLISQIPTWHADHTAAVFCAWVALQAAKGKARVQIEPNVVLQGAAGSGKTRGLFSFASRLTGTERAAISTFPTLRDRLCGQRNGIVVIDDMTEVDPRILELYRLSTSSETMTKKAPTHGQGWVDEQFKLVGSLVISGEVLAHMSTDRALRDRSIILEVPQANRTPSLQDPSRLQWDDIQAVFTELGGATEETAHQLAGPFIRRILAAVDEIGQPPVGSADRVAIKLDLIRYGARLWQAAYPESKTYQGMTLPEAVEEWCLEQASSSDWRSLTLINRILHETVDPNSGAFGAVRFDESGFVLIQPGRLARFWQSAHRSPRDQELGSEANILRELEELASAGLATRGHQRRMGGTPTRVWMLDEIVSVYLAVSTGVSTPLADVTYDTLGLDG